MLEALVTPDLTIQLSKISIPKPGAGDVLIKVLVSGSNPKDWKIPKWLVAPNLLYKYQLTSSGCQRLKTPVMTLPA
jgi:NADPH:quinone reductase-like Zn-dependent oxidoreductase